MADVVFGVAKALGIAAATWVVMWVAFGLYCDWCDRDRRDRDLK